MLRFRINHLCRLLRLRSFSTSHITTYLDSRLSFFLSNHISDLQSLQSHAYIITTGHTNNIFIASKLISLYASLRKPNLSTKVFDSVHFKDTFLWNSIIKAHFSNGNYPQALQFYLRMRVCDSQPNHFTIPMVVAACAELSSLHYGMKIHGLVSKLGLSEGNSAVGSSFVYMYSKCGCLQDASLMFDVISVKDVIAWTSLIIGYVQNDESEKGLECLCEMHKIAGDGERPNVRTLEGGLQACGNLGASREGRCLHGLVIKIGIGCSHVIQSSLLSMYSKCGTVEEAYLSFCEVRNKDLISWTSIVGVYAKLGRIIECLVRRNHVVDQMVHNALLSMYCKFGLPALAEKLFDRAERDKEAWNMMVFGYGKMGLGDTVSWNTLISSYALSGHSAEALALFDKMISEGFKPNSATLVTVLSACSCIASLEKGEQVHSYIREGGFEFNLSLATALVDMYAKCGKLEKSREIFNVMKEKDVVSWNVMISGYAMHGDAESAIEIFRQMELSNVRPNELTFLAVLSACTHAGLVEEGKFLFDRMGDYSVRPTLKHYASMVDLLGRSGNLHDAEALVLSMPIAPDGSLWGALLSACKIHNDTEMGIRIAKHAIESDTENDGYYIMLSNLYTSIGRWEEAERVRITMKDRGVRKKTGWSAV
ncbi:hypothetical protein F0562_003223 [Nyssa sinensis]|uniref:Pentacotripeptide-repeat region of PRORP domain-containing protein n=1 Tax=Nyssa sinensis TaxID=561372 RepID=A0A5J5BVX9_9ASTE|nr:hypothetical protein F0562_003223 [Nyssa sinensis]